MAEPNKEARMRAFGWLNASLLMLLGGVGLVRTLTALLSTSTTVSVVTGLLFVAAVANAILLLLALFQRQFFLAVLCLLVAGGSFLIAAGILSALTVGSLGK